MTVTMLTSKGQVTIPHEVRKARNVHPGDFLAWELMANGQVNVCKVEPLDLEYIRALEKTLSEWNSPEDGVAYRDLLEH